MRCQQAQQRLQVLLDERTDFDTDDILRQHLGDCAECAILAAAYDALRCRQPSCEQQASGAIELPGLAHRVLAEVAAAPSCETTLERPTASASTAASSTWQWYSLRGYSALAAAACILIAVGVSLWNQGAVIDSPSASGPMMPADPAGSQPLANSNVPPEADTQEVVMPGSEVFNRAGRGLASISLVRMRWQSTSNGDSEQSSDEPILPRAFDTLRTFWPNEWETTSPAGNETGYRFSGQQVLLA